MNTTAIIVLVVVFLLVVVLLGMYNGLVSRRNFMDKCFLALDEKLQKRLALIPELAATLEEHVRHDRSARELLDDIKRLGLEAQQDGTANARLEADDKMSPLFKDLLLATRSYPQLKSDDSFLHLQRTLTELEEQTIDARRASTKALKDYNTTVQSFPASVVGGALGFKPRDFFGT